MQAVMMVAGKSTRTYPLTLTRPKPLLPVLNRPLIYFNLDQLVGLVEEAILIVGYRKEMISNMLGDQYRGLKLIYQEQTEQLGTGHAVLQAKHHIRDRFLVLNGDDLFAREDMEKMLPNRYAALAMTVSDPSQYGVYQVNDKQQAVRLVEKPKETISDLANVGCYLFEPGIFSLLENVSPSVRGEIEITEAIQKVAGKKPFQVVSLTEYWLPTGFPWDLLKTQRHLFDHQFESDIQGTIEESAHIRGKIQLGRGSVVRDGAQILGPVVIGQECEIEPMSVVGPYVSIGDHTQIEPQNYIEQAILMDRCKIGSNSIIRHSVVGEDVRVGESCQCISRNPEDVSVESYVKGKWIDTHLHQLGSIIADGVQLGANTIILPGCKLWPEKVTSVGSHIKQDIRD